MHLFDDGWNAIAERIFENQNKLGVVPANAKLPPWPDFLPKWETLTADQKKLYVRQINVVWAAHMAYSDHEIGRIVDTVEKLNLSDNTMIVYVLGDNGMSAEGSLHGTPNEVAYFNGYEYAVEQMLPLIPVWGTDLTYPHFAVPWAFAMDTPYRWVKQIASHLGGTRTGMVVSLGLGAFTPAHALLALPDPADFVLIESDGQYTIINNSSDWYIWAFEVTNFAAADGRGDPSTGQTNWAAGDCASGCLTDSPAFSNNNTAGAYTDLTDDVGPGQSSNLFYFVAAEDSTEIFQVTNGSVFYNITPSGSAVPELSTWAMLIAGFGFLGRRYALQRGGLRRLIGAA